MTTPTKGDTMNDTCVVYGCKKRREGWGMCAHHLFAWAMRRA
jgi:hypothetical protein